MGSFLVNHVEDIALGIGTVAVSVGVALSFGPGFGLIAFGALSVAYGVWISLGPRRERD